MDSLQLLIFITAWVTAVYILNCLFARSIKKIEIISVLLYISAMALLGVFGEVVIDSIYFLVNGRPLWVYEILPIHNAFTSQYSLAIWGMVGFHMYLMHDTLKEKGITSINKLSLIFCGEAILLEALVNLSFLAFFGEYVYFYLPQDLWHVTSLQVIPLYLIAGYICVYAVKRLQLKPKLFITPCLSLALILVRVQF